MAELTLARSTGTTAGDGRLASAPALRELVTRQIAQVLAGSAHTAGDPQACPPWLAGYADPGAAQTVTEVDGPLGRLELADALLLTAAGLVEHDVRFGALFAHLQAPLESRRPCVGLLRWLLPGAPDEIAGSGLPGGGADLAVRAQRLARRGLLHLDNPGDPRSEWVVRIPVPVWDLVQTGQLHDVVLPAGLTFRPAGSFPPLDALALGPDAAEIVTRLPGLVADGGLGAVVVRGSTGSGRTTVLGALAATLGRDLLVYDGSPGDQGWALFGALASIGPVLPVVRCAAAAGETITFPRLDGVTVPLGVVAGRGGGLAGDALDPAVTVVLGGCDRAARRRLWAGLGGPATEAELDLVADRFHLSPGNIHRVAPVAAVTARAAGRTRLTAADVATAARTLNRQGLETLATRLDPLPAGSPPVLSPAAADEFETLVLRCRHRERLSAAGGGPGGLNQGVRALFSGPSGTGKTFAARHLATALGLDAYRVDLSAVVNKYIGETERNLDGLLTAAESLDVLLLLDEGDALMTRRTDVSDANDRYANLETNFLLQRLETFEGIVVVTTNAGSRIDPAFLRRIDVTVDFVPPGAALRRQIWTAHLPAGHRVGPELLSEVVRRCDLTGGQIRNAALHATLLSLESGAEVGDGDLVAAVRREYRRAGASCPLPA
jgi:hypothetical protein